MNVFKAISLSIFFSVFFLGSSVLAQDSGVSKMTPIAQVNIQNAKVASQVGNVFNISFVLANKEGVQSGVRYGVRLVSKTDPRVVFDDYVYEEALSLEENTQIQKSVVYTAPNVLSGSYNLYAIVNNAEGFPFSVVSLGEVSLSASQKWVTISPETCVTTASGEQNKTHRIFENVFIKKDQTLELSCIAQNNTSGVLVVAPRLKTYEKSLGGASIETGQQNNSTISFKPNEKKKITLQIPPVSTPQAYITKVSLGAGDISSNEIFVRYTIEGVSATIFNISADKDFYTVRDKANISVIWSGIGVSGSSMDVSLSTRGVSCGEVQLPTIALGKQDVSIPVKFPCRNPEIFVVIKDKEGTPIAQKTISIVSKTIEKEGGVFSGARGAVLMIIVLIAVVLLGIFLKKKSQSRIPPIAVLVFVVGLLSFGTSYADTYPVGPSGSGIFATVTVTPDPTTTTFQQGGTLQVDGFITSTSPIDRDVSLSSVTVGNTQVQLFSPSVQTVGPSNPQVFGQPYMFTVNVPLAGGNPIPGTYGVDFSAGLNDEIPVIQNYSNYGNLGAIMGICRVMPDPYSGAPGFLRGTRDAATEASATARGVTSVDYSFSIRTDNYPNPQMSTFTVRFYPGELSVDVPGVEGGLNHDAGGYCSTINCEGYTCPEIPVVENF